MDKFQTSKDQTALAGLTKHDLTGAIMQAGVQSYFAVNQAQDVIAQKQARIISNPKLSYGTFSIDLKTEYRYGIAWRTSPKGLMMDIDRILKQTIDKDNSNDKVIAFNRSTGVRESLNENLIPEQLFDDPNTPEKEAQGISAVKALQIAAQQGQTIYTITQANYAQILPKLNHADDVMQDVSNAINAGKEVTISQTQVHAFGWSGSGYIILDPSNGTGAYMIGGGADGGWIDLKFALALSIIVLIPLAMLFIAGPLSFFIGAAFAMYTLLVKVPEFINGINEGCTGDRLDDYGTQFLTNTALTALVTTIFAGVVAFLGGASNLAEKFATLLFTAGGGTAWKLTINSKSMNKGC